MLDDAAGSRRVVLACGYVDPAAVKRFVAYQALSWIALIYRLEETLKALSTGKTSGAANLTLTLYRYIRPIYLTLHKKSRIW